MKIGFLKHPKKLLEFSIQLGPKSSLVMTGESSTQLSSGKDRSGHIRVHERSEKREIFWMGGDGQKREPLGALAVAWRTRGF